MEMKVKRREWVKTAAIIFLAVLLVLTFFSNTIMNYSLPEVATQSVESGSINAKIRGTGTVAANESYEVTVEQSHKVASVLVKQGQQVKVDDVLFRFEGGESDELKAAQDALDQAEQGYEKSLIEAGNAAAKENREIQKARDAYNEALAVYQQYSTMSATQIATKLAEAEIKLKDLQTESSQADTDYTNLSTSTEYTEAKSNLSSLQANVDSLSAKVEEYQAQLDKLQQGENVQNQIAQKKSELASAQSELDAALKNSTYQALSDLAGGKDSYMSIYVSNHEQLKARIMEEDLAETDAEAQSLAEEMTAAYSTAQEKRQAVDTLSQDLSELQQSQSNYDSYDAINSKLTSAQRDLRDAESDLSSAQRTIRRYDKDLEALKDTKDTLAQQVTDQQAEYDKLSKASSAASTMKSAKDTLENLVFEQNLADSASVDMKAAKESIEKQRENVEKLKKAAEGGEVKSPVNGTISSLSVSAGQTANAGTALATIDVTDRGYTLKIPVTNEQAKKVTIGEQAELVNYWWGGDDITATLESIGTDPANPGKGKQLTFRLNGTVEPGQSITLSIGQKSANYDCLVPNSAVRSDNNGSFVLLVTSKSSPLGNRYTATRVSVNVLASDDTSTAVTGLSAGDFVLTTSSKPVSSGMQVRLADES